MKMKLTIKTRVQIMGILDLEKGSYAKRGMIDDIIKECSLTEKEMIDSEYIETIHQEGGMSFVYKQEKDPMKKIEFNNIVLELIVNNLKKLQDTEQIGKNEMSLYKQFVLKED